MDPKPGLVETDIPARLDRLPWGRFHTLVVVALGITWILDGLEVTIAGSIAGALKADPRLHFSDEQVGLAASCYLVGAVFGALFFGWLTDRLGRKKLFFITLGVYLAATAATAFSWDFASYCLFRALTGAGVGGEYSAINSAIQELIPARFRGRVDLAINGTFWVGAALGAGASVVLLDPARFSIDTGWRLAFGLGAALGLIVLALRAFLPESPRWLTIHGRPREADAIMAEIEQGLRTRGHALAGAGGERFVLRMRMHTPLREVFTSMFVTHRGRALVGLVLMAAQAFFYNAIFFTYGLVLTRFYGMTAADVGWHILPFALGNVLGPLLLGPLFDTFGRRAMIAATYALSGLTLVASATLFLLGLLDANTQTLCWSVVFFFASPAASAAYLTVGESFPIEIRALAIAFFYAFGTGIGGVAAPWLFGALVGSGSRPALFGGYLFGAALMLVAAGIAARWGVAAERKPLESVARPLSAHDG